MSEVARLSTGRTLILTPDPAAADRLAERLASLGVVRALADDENPMRPSPIVAKRTSTVLGRDSLEAMKGAASEAVAMAEARLAGCDRLEQVETEIATLIAKRARAEADIVSGPTTAELADKEAALTTLRRRAAEVSSGPLRKSGIFTWLFRRPQPPGPELAEIDKQIHVLQAEIAALVVARDNAVRVEVAARCAALDEEIQAREAERTRLGGELGSAGQRDFEHELKMARERLAALNTPDAVQHVLVEPRVVVGTPGSLQADPVFEALAAANESFSLLILDRCEELTEADFLRLAALAPRRVLVGNARPAEGPALRLLHAAPSGNGKAGRSERGRSFAARLARLVDRESWVHEPGRLICRLLHPITPTGRRPLAREPLLDRPEIELGFAADENGDPVVAEVAFPATTPITEAKSFLFHELGEVLLRPCGEPLWDDPPSVLTVRWPAAEANGVDSAWISLESGVREKVAGTGTTAFTAAIEFDGSAGWDREKAEAWLAKHLQTESTGRFAALPAEFPRYKGPRGRGPGRSGPIS